MKRKTIILLSSVLAGSLLVGGAFAAYAVTDNANPIGVDVRTQAPDQDTPVEIMWGEEAHADIADLDSGKYAKAGYFTVKSTVEYEGTFSVKMADKTPQAIIDAKGTENPVYLFDNLEVFVYSGHVALDDGNIPAELPEGVELVGSISTNTAKQEDGSKLWSKLVTTDLDGKVFTVLVKSEATDDVLGQLSQDVVGITVDWGMGPDSHEAEPAVIEDGYYLVGTFNNWKMEAATKLAYDEQKQEYSIQDVELAANAEVKVVGHKDGEDDVYYPASTDQDDNNIPLVAGSYDIYFVTTYKADWETGSSYDGAYGIAGHFWIVPQSEQGIDDYIIWGTKDGQLWEKLATLEQDGTQYKVLGLELAKDTEFTIHLNGAVYKEFYDIKTNSTAYANFEAKGGTDDLTKNNIVVKVAGTYDIYADTVADTAGKFVWIEEHNDQPEPQPTETVYRVVGDFNSWTYSNGVALELVSGSHYQATGVVLEADGAVKVTDGGSAWYGVHHWYEGCGYEQQDTYQDGNAPLKAGTYTVNLYTDSQDGNFLSFVKTA